jgi:hypothetical protein
MHAHLPLRLTRAAAFAAVCVTLAALAHWLGGGIGPAPWAAALGLALVFAPAMALSRKERPTRSSVAPSPGAVLRCPPEPLTPFTPP